MKLPTKPISSPSRTEKFPPPLMRFLRSNGGSRSRGRSRSSPMFVRKKTTAIETQEPSSPKVTCMGQVRVRRTSKQDSSKRRRPTKTGAPASRRCKWVFCYNKFGGKLKSRSFRPALRRWASYLFLINSKIRKGSSKSEPKFEDKIRDSDDCDEEENKETDLGFVSTSCTPPRNALILTRSRSAPYRSCSLASRFWDSPSAAAEETGEEQKTEQDSKEGYKLVGNENPTSESEPVCRDADHESKTDPETEEKPECSEEFETPIKQRFVKSANIEELRTKEEEEASIRPSMLTRCKSEPARTAVKLGPETMSFWEKRRLGFLIN